MSDHYIIRRDPLTGRASAAAGNTHVAPGGCGWPGVVEWAAAQTPPVDVDDWPPDLVRAAEWAALANAARADAEAVAASPEYQAHLLRRAQDARAAAVDARTAELQAAGFEFPAGSGQRFDLTPATQATWVSLMVGASAGLLEYPVNAGVIGDGTYQLQDASAVVVFCAAALARGRAIIEGGAAVKKLVYAATTVAAVEAVEDTRE